MRQLSASTDVSATIAQVIIIICPPSSDTPEDSFLDDLHATSFSSSQWCQSRMFVPFSEPSPLLEWRSCTHTTNTSSQYFPHTSEAYKHSLSNSEHSKITQRQIATGSWVKIGKLPPPTPCEAGLTYNPWRSMSENTRDTGRFFSPNKPSQEKASRCTWHVQSQLSTVKPARCLVPWDTLLQWKSKRELNDWLTGWLAGWRMCGVNSGMADIRLDWKTEPWNGPRVLKECRVHYAVPAREAVRVLSTINLCFSKLERHGLRWNMDPPEFLCWSLCVIKIGTWLPRAFRPSIRRSTI